MPGRGAPYGKRLARLRGVPGLTQDRFRYVTSGRSQQLPPSIQWASCNMEPQEPDPVLIVTNPGTSFAQVMPQTPTFASFVTFPKPCGEK